MNFKTEGGIAQISGVNKENYGANANKNLFSLYHLISCGLIIII